MLANVILKVCPNVNDNAESTNLIVFYEAISLSEYPLRTHSKPFDCAVVLRLKFYIRALTATRIEGLVVQG
jgi:hypothetical protein